MAYKFNPFTGTLDVDTDSLSTLATITSHYTGWAERTTTTLTWNNTTYTLSVTGTDFPFYIDGVKYTTSALTKQITDVTGLYWFWITVVAGVPTLNASTTAPGFDKCLTATVYWNTTTNVGILSDERHWMGRDMWNHEYLHETVGARYHTGMTIAPTDTTFSITAGDMYDEDIEHKLSNSTTCKVMYKNRSADWEWDDNSVLLYKLNGTSMRYNNVNALADVPNASYVAMWVFATNNITTPFMSIIGQRTDTTIANARTNNTPNSLSFGSLPSAEMKLLYRVIFKQNVASVSYIETADYRAVSNLPVSNFTGTDHSALTNLAYAISGHSGFQKQVEEYDNADPASPTNGDIWVKRTVTVDGEAGSPRGLLLSLTYAGDGVSTYELSFKTIDLDIKRVAIT
jgi:hypothetical protein